MVRVAERELFVDLVVVAPSVASLRDVAGLLELIDDLRGRSFGYADRHRDVTKPSSWVGRDARQHVCVVRHEPPGMVKFSGI
jgi:hypothetical protein